jgi:beta-N-acetylhexosaminidase
MTSIAPVIFGCKGQELTQEELDFFRGINPFGFILFARNIGNPIQVKQLVEQMRSCSTCKNAPILIDQEGGRIQRLRPPYWKDFPSAADIANSHSPIVKAFKNALEMGEELTKLGINVNCTPVLDVPTKDSHDIIGDRAYGDDARTVSIFGRAVCDGAKKAGILPVIKHIPGHGRAKSDSHKDLPIVNTSKRDLERTDFAAFKSNHLNKELFAMTAHVVYSDIDSENPATQSATVIKEIIRDFIGFNGILMTDDLSMEALQGKFADRAIKSLNAGCDIVLHCNGDMDEMKQIAKAIKLENRQVSGRIYGKWLTALNEIADSSL